MMRTHGDMAQPGMRPQREAAGRTAPRAVAATLLCAVVLTVAGCMAPRNSFFAGVNPQHWEHPAEVVVPNGDTLSMRRLSVVLRCNRSFGSDSLPLDIAVISPDSQRFCESVVLGIPEYRQTAVTGIVSVPYRENVCLRRCGDYKFVFKPHAAVQGIEAVGIEVTPQMN